MKPLQRQMTFTDDKGKRIHLWLDDEVEIDDEEAFMDRYVDRIVAVLENEPIDIYVNATFFPEVIAVDCDRLWTDRVIQAAVRNGVAIEINSRYRIPSPLAHDPSTRQDHVVHETRRSRAPFDLRRCNKHRTENA